MWPKDWCRAELPAQWGSEVHQRKPVVNAVSGPGLFKLFWKLLINRHPYEDNKNRIRLCHCLCVYRFMWCRIHIEFLLDVSYHLSLIYFKCYIVRVFGFMRNTSLICSGLAWRKWNRVPMQNPAGQQFHRICVWHNIRYQVWLKIWSCMLQR